jgi:hypothetical protein
MARQRSVVAPSLLASHPRQSAEKAIDFDLQAREGGVWRRAVQVVDVPELHPIQEAGKGACQHLSVLGSLHRHDVIGSRQIGSRHGQWQSPRGIVVDALKLQSRLRVA